MPQRANRACKVSLSVATFKDMGRPGKGLTALGRQAEHGKARQSLAKLKAEAMDDLKAGKCCEGEARSPYAWPSQTKAGQAKQRLAWSSYGLPGQASSEFQTSLIPSFVSLLMLTWAPID